MKHLLTLLFVGSSFFLCAQNSILKIDTLPGPKPWTSLNLNNDSHQFQIAIVSDRTGGHRPGIFMDGVRKLNLLQPEFVLSVGDLIEGYTENLSTLEAQWNEFNGFIDSLEMPFFYVPGNHDITNKVMEKLYIEKFGKTYYHFVYKDVLFLCLNSEDQCRGAGKGTISDEQYTYIENTLNEHPNVRWTMIFMHQPLWNQENPERWPDVERLLSNRRHTVFTGHVHHYAKETRNNGKYFTLATTGGGSNLTGPQFGEFDHVTWLTMTEDGPVLANLQLEGIWGENVSTRETRNYFQKIVRSSCVQIEPVYATEENWISDLMNIKLINDHDVPMQINLKGSFSWDLSLAIGENKYVIPPNSVELVTVELGNKRKNLSFDNVRPMKLRVEVSLKSEELPDLTVPMTYYLAPESKKHLKTVENKINVDGNLSEWHTLPHKLKGTGSEDCQASFELAYDENYLYVAVKVLDEYIHINTQDGIWNIDFIGVIINADPFLASARDRGSGRYRNSFFYMQSPNSDSVQGFPGTNAQDVKGVISKCIPVKGGYTLETAIPIKFVKERQGDDWRTVRFNMVIQDVDEGEEELLRYTFRPEWRSKENRTGSGMFFRELHNSED